MKHSLIMLTKFWYFCFQNILYKIWTENFKLILLILLFGQNYDNMHISDVTYMTQGYAVHADPWSAPHPGGYPKIINA